MPTYQYACTSCGHRLEVVQSFSDAALTECPVCGGALRKVFSPVGVVFKGSGFYRTDSRATAKSPAADGKDGGTKEGAKDGSTKEGAKESASSGSTGSSASTESAGSKGSSGSTGSSGSSGSSSGSSGSSTTGSAA